MKYKVQYGWPNAITGVIDQWYDWTHGLTELHLVNAGGLQLPSQIYAREEDGYFSDYLAAEICRREVREAIIARDGTSEGMWESRVVEVPDEL